MKKRLICAILAIMMILFVGCGEKKKQVADSTDMAEPVDVLDESMTPVYGDSLQDGVYDIAVDSSSTMFKIAACELTVSGGEMTAKLTMNSKSYLYLFMGTGEEAVKADESEYISYVDDGEGSSFTVPVSALDAGIDCAAFSKNKEMWYDRTLVFRADSLPLDAFNDGVIVTAASMGLDDGDYTVDVTLTGGSGRASVQSPADFTVTGGEATVNIVWSSSNYDYMKVDGVRYDPVSVEEYSVFEIPLTAFDRQVTVIADTTAMSEPHEIEYTLYFDSTTVK